LKSLFSISDDQFVELLSNWQKLYNSNLEEFYGTQLIGNPGFSDEQRAGYWQWAEAYIT